MFTGIIKEQGKIVDIVKEPGKTTLSICNNTIAKNTNINDSIAINGCCLTVININENILMFHILPETLTKTSFNLLKVGQIVNLEESLTLNDKIGGHLIQGHIDCTATIINETKEGESTIFYFKLNKLYLNMLVPKAFISIDGISLTVVEVTLEYFSVMLIPHTKSITTVKTWQKGAIVNIEIDIINKSTFYYINNLTSKT